MSYDLRLTVPGEDEIKGLSIEEILALFQFDKADSGLVEPPTSVVFGLGGTMRQTLFWTSTGTALARPINATGNLSATSRYTGLTTVKAIVGSGVLASSQYTFGETGDFLIMGNVSAQVPNATDFGDVVMGIDNTTAIGPPTIMRDTSVWGCSGTMMEVRTISAGMTLAFHSRYTTGVAINITAYYFTLMALRLK